METQNLAQSKESISYSEKSDDELTLSPEKFPIARYAPQKLLGSGGSGTVYLARDRVLKKNVAVKLLNQLTGAQLILFQDEARATSRLNHKNIIQIFDFGPTENGTPYMVLAYIPSATTLDEQIKTSGTLAVEDALEIFLNVCEGLEHAHQMGVFHRDLKPSNILIAPGENGQTVVKLIDFGVAKYIDLQDPTRPQATTIAGTPAYMAPEQIRAEPYDARSEIYSLGCVFFETLTGQPPFVALTALETMALHASEDAPTISEVSITECPAKLEELIAWCLEKEKDDRPGSVSELREALETIDIRSKETPPKIPEQTAPPARSNKMLAYLLVIGALLLLVWPVTFMTKLESITESNQKYKVQFNEPTTPLDMVAPAQLTVTRSDWSTLNTAKNTQFIETIKARDSNLANPEVLAPLFRFPRLTAVEFTDCSGLSKAAVTALVQTLSKKSASSHPLYIGFINCDFDDSGLTEISRLRNLEFLSLESTNITDAGVRSLSSAPNLLGVDLTNTAITNDAIASLKKLKRLMIVRADLCEISASSISNLGPAVTVIHHALPMSGDTERSIFQEAAANANPIAEYEIGRIYQFGKGEPANSEEAIKWYRRAANHGYVKAQTATGYLLQHSEQPDLRAAGEWYKRAEKNGSDEAPYLLASLYLNGGTGVEINHKLAMKHLRIAADRGNLEAMQTLGTIYKSGAGVTQDFSQAYHWFHKAALKGNDKALYEVAKMHLDGVGVEQNSGEAMKWLLRAANAGNALAEAHIGMLYEKGVGVTHDYNLAVSWYTRSAKHGCASGMGNLARLYYDGIGVVKDEEKALSLLTEAADHGDPIAMNSLGIMYMNGVADKQPDYDRARSWLQQAINLNVPGAMYNMGLMNEKGLGQEPDLERAKAWYRKALVAGYTEALPRLKRLEKRK